MKLKIGSLIQWNTTAADYDNDELYSSSDLEKHVGMVTKKASRGYWVLWGDGSHKILPRDLIKYVKLLS